VPAFVNTGVAFYAFDATGGCTTHWFNDNDLLIREQDPLGNITTHEINGFDRKLSTTDALGRVTETHTPDGAIWRYTYDAFDRRIRKECVKPGEFGGHLFGGHLTYLD
jgi:YD repeat-containing protein